MIVVLAGGGTGGHLMPALALADALIAVRSDVEPVIVGSRRGVEATILPHRPYRYHLVAAEPIYRRTWWRNIRWLGLAPRLAAQCRRVLAEERPRLVVGTGGYAAGPLLWFAARRGIPIALQEQNAMPGVTTRRLAPRAAQVHLGFSEAESHLHPGPDTAVFTLGNPITPPSAASQADAKRRLGVAPDIPVVLVTGGSQGARAINHAVAQMVTRDLLPRMVLLWSTGPGAFDGLRAFDRPPDVQVRPFWDPIAEAYAAADLVVARAGAMTTAELAAWGLPSVLVPLPSAAADHQSANATAMAAAGAAVHLPQAALTPDAMEREITALLRDRARLTAMAGQARARGRPDAARAIAECLGELL